MSNKELFTALAKAQSAYEPVKKSGVNTYFNNSKYPTLNDFIDASIKALSENGLSISQWFITKDDGKTYLKTKLAHSSGEFEESEFELIIGKKDMQGFGSAGTYGRRYAYAAAAGLAPEDDDGNDAAKNAPTEKPSANRPYVKPADISPPHLAPVKTLVNHAPISKTGITQVMAEKYFAMTEALGWSHVDAIAHLSQQAKKSLVSQLTKEEYTLITSKLQVELDKANTGV